MTEDPERAPVAVGTDVEQLYRADLRRIVRLAYLLTGDSSFARPGPDVGHTVAMLQAHAERAAAIDRLRDVVMAIEVPHTVRVCIDGITASGKTTLAAELADAISAAGRPVWSRRITLHTG